VLTSDRWYIGVNGYSSANCTLRAPVTSGGSGSTRLQIDMTGSGDGDLYVRACAQPTASTYDYRPYVDGSTESVTITPSTTPPLQTGTYNVSAYGHPASMFTLKVVAE
jgi:hypothetical protein